MSVRPVVAIIDDDRRIRDGLSSLLRADGYRVAHYGSSEDFLATLSDARPDCLLTDVQLPLLDGLDLQMRLREEHPDLPVIVMTAYPNPSLRERALRQGALCFLSKPFAHGELLRCIQLAIGE